MYIAARLSHCIIHHQHTCSCSRTGSGQLIEISDAAVPSTHNTMTDRSAETCLTKGSLSKVANYVVLGVLGELIPKQLFHTWDPLSLSVEQHFTIQTLTSPEMAGKLRGCSVVVYHAASLWHIHLVLTVRLTARCMVKLAAQSSIATHKTRRAQQAIE